MTKLYTVDLGFHTIAVLAENEKAGTKLLVEMVQKMILNIVEEHDDHEIVTIESDDKKTVHLYCNTCNHLFFLEDNSKDGFNRPIGFVWDDKR